jgi:hypothetical protein
MSTIHLHQTTTSTPEQSSPGSPTSGRSKLFGNSADESMTVILRPKRHAAFRSASTRVSHLISGFEWPKSGPP